MSWGNFTGVVAQSPHRRHLPDERTAVVHSFSVGGWEGTIRVGLFDDGSPGEIFLDISKRGSVVSGLMRGVALGMSMMLQHGVPLEIIVKKYKGMNFEPYGVTPNENIPRAKSLLDYVARWLEQSFIPPEQREKDE